MLLLSRSHIPLLLTSLRAMLAPVMLLLAWYYPRPMLFGVGLILAFLSAAWHLHSTELRVYLPALVVLGALEVLRYAIDLWKFRREAAYHLWSSKLWGIGLFIGFFALLVRGRGGLFVGVPLYVGILVDLEGLAVSLVLKEWKSDVPSIVHAWRLRRAPIYATGSTTVPWW